MLNNFKTCPVCQLELLITLKYENQPGAKCGYHYKCVNGVWEQIQFNNRRIFFHCSNFLSIDIYFTDNTRWVELDNATLSYKDLDTYDKCLEIVNNYHLLK